MQNGYFRLVSDEMGFGIALYQPKGGGEEIQAGELWEYLDGHSIAYDRKRIEMALMEDEDSVCHIGRGGCPEIPETYILHVSEDKMMATVRFLAPSETGPRMSYGGFMKDMQFQKITWGVQEKLLRDHFSTDCKFCTDILLAKGCAPVAGVDAKIEYLFETDLRRKPTQKEDGSVDYFHMTIINQCRAGDMLARILPEQPGKEGFDIYGHAIPPRLAKPAVLKFGRNITLSDDKKEIYAAVDGHVSLVDDKVFLSDVYEVEDVGVATGNIEFEGSVQVNGDVSENFEVKAGGHVIVNGIVEGARIVAGGNIIIAKGMNGMQKGFLKAGGNVVVKFLENARVVAGGYVEAEAILHSRVSSGSEVTVDGKKAVIVGGYVQAASRIISKFIGAQMGATTILEVGVNPLIKTQYTRMQKAITENTKTVKNAEVILKNFKDKLKKGFQYNENQIKYMKSVAQLVEEKTSELENMNNRLEQLREMMEIQKQAEVVIMDEIYPGTTIMIGDASKTMQNSYHYCKFIREQGEVKMAPL